MDFVKLFDPFFTTKPEDNRKDLGLSVCYTIIEKYDGNLEVEKQYSKEGTFIIDLPVEKQSDTSKSD
ncbi:MAG: ATP-binding protein [Nitrospinota bacterium]|nr:ATP-binding protein [Nitrospinota bacterium]